MQQLCPPALEGAAGPRSALGSFPVSLSFWEPGSGSWRFCLGRWRNCPALAIPGGSGLCCLSCPQTCAAPASLQLRSPALQVMDISVQVFIFLAVKE